MKGTIFEVVDLINRLGIDNILWGIQTIHEENDNNTTDKLFGTSANMILPKGTYLWWYLLESELPDIEKLECKQHSSWVIKKEFCNDEKMYLYLWKIC